MNSYVNDFNLTVNKYYNDLRNFKPLSKQEEHELLVLAQNNDTNAQNKLVECNLKFVFDIAKNYKGYGVPLEDLISEGNLGLTKAIKKFNISHDVKFISYAVWWIRYYITDFIKKNLTIDSNEFSDSDLYNDKVYNDGILDDEDDSIYKIDVLLSDENDTYEKEMNKEKNTIVNNLLCKLDNRSKTIIEMYYGLNGYEEMTLHEIGEIFSISKERVRQICKRSLTKFRNEVMLSNNFCYSI